MAKVIFRLNLQGKTPSTYSIPQNNVMANKPGKGNKFIAYYPGQDSCYVEDITEKNKDLRPAKVPLFEYNVSTKQTELAVDESNFSLINYLKIHPFFNKKYFIYSKNGEAEKELSAYKEVEKALELIKESDETKVKAIAMAVFGLSSFNKTYTQCAAELKGKALKDPNAIILPMNEPNYETKYAAGLAFVSGIIKLNPTHTAIVWSDNEGLILHIAQGENGLDKLTNFLTNETKEAQVLLQEFNNRLERKQKSEFSSNDAEQIISEKDAEIEELKRQLAESNKAKEEVPVINETAEVQEKEEEEENDSDENNEPISLKQLQEDYVKKTGKELPSRYKNDEVWLAKELAK